MKSANRWAMGLAVLLAALLLGPPAQGQLRIRSGALKSELQHPKELEKRIFQLTNEARRENGLDPLEPDDTLAKLARAKCDDMLEHQYFSHTGPGGQTLKDRFIEAERADSFRMVGGGENISMASRNDYADTEATAREVVDSFMVSPEHRRNILNPHYTHLGVGVGISPDGKHYFVSQDFGIARKTP